MFRVLIACFVLPTLPAAALGNDAPATFNHQQIAAQLPQSDPALDASRASSPECEAGCITPNEAVALAYAAGEGNPTPGRFLLDVRGGGQSLSGELDDLFFISSQQGYARLGTLTIAMERDALWSLLRRARVCGGGAVQPGQIEVRGCHRTATSDLNIFSMMEALGNRRIVVEGEVRLMWIDAATGAPRPVANKRGENELGYYQVWVRVDDADQVIFVYDD